MKKYLNEVEARLRAIEKNAKPDRWLAKNYVGGGLSKLDFLDIKIPVVRAEFKKGFSFSKLPPEKQWPIWDYIWNHSNTFEVMLLASFFAASRPFLEMHKHHKLVLGWLARVDNWAHSDEMSSHYSKLLEHDPEKMMPVFKKWNRSLNPWFKRQSMVGLLYYARSRKRKPPVEILLDFVERHMDDDHYYVQKGVGWTLREAWNVYPKETLAYIKKNAGRIAPAGWTAATEKLSPQVKHQLSGLRAAARKGKAVSTGGSSRKLRLQTQGGMNPA